MSGAPAEHFNLVFAGELMPDTSRDAAQVALAGFFGVSDAAAMARFFDGRPIPLRRRVSKSEATRLYRQLRSQGLLCEIVPHEVPAAPATRGSGRSRPGSG